MPKKGPPPNPLQDKIDTLRRLGIEIVSMKSRQGSWMIKRVAEVAPLPLTSPHGYETQGDAINAAWALTGKLRQYRADTDKAREEYDRAIAQDGIATVRIEPSRRKFDAAKEYERTEARRLSLPVRG